MPWRFEPGTPNVSGAIGLAAAVDYLSKLGMNWVRKHEVELTKLAMKRLAELDKVTVYGPKNVEERGGIISFNVKGVDGHDVALLLDEFENIAVRSGLHLLNLYIGNWIFKAPYELHFTFTTQKTK